MSDEVREALRLLVEAAERDILRRSCGHNDGGQALRDALENAQDILDATYKPA